MFWNVRAMPGIADLGGRKIVDPVPIHADLAGRWGINARDDIECRGFSRAVGTNERNQLAGAQLKGEPFEGREPAETARESLTIRPTVEAR